jgi:hypothetical protein
VRLAAGLLLAALACAALAHPAPSSILRLELRTAAVRAEYWVPVSELEYARAADPAGDLPAYLLRHVAAETAAGVRWRVTVASVREAAYQQHAYLVARLDFEPPAGSSARDLVLIDDAVTHEVRNHVVYVVARRDAESGVVGALQYPARRLEISPR